MIRVLSFLVLIFTVSLSPAAEPLIAHFIDVGQGDATFIQSPDGKTMLVDGGENNGMAERYLASIGVKKIDILVASHPHLDHIGGLAKIIQNYEIGQVVMPRVTTTTTVTYTKLLEAIKAKGLRVTEGKAGLVLDLGPSVQAECLAPNSKEYKDINDYSVVIKLTHGNVSILMTGDATTVSEKEMLQNHANKLNATILKVGHHGSSSSSSAAFVKAVAPQVTVFSCGKGNDYGHPTQVVWNRLSNSHMFRTDEQGSIILTTNGQTMAAYSPPVNGQYQTLAAYQTPGAVVAQNQSPVAAQTQPAIATQYSQPEGDVVYVTKSGSKYHKAGCRSLSDSAVPLLKSEAVQKYGPCGICKP